MMQAAVLLVFQSGVSRERARQIADEFCRSLKNPDEEPSVAQVEVFDPDRGGVVIYQP